MDQMNAEAWSALYRKGRKKDSNEFRLQLRRMVWWCMMNDDNGTVMVDLQSTCFGSDRGLDIVC